MDHAAVNHVTSESATIFALVMFVAAMFYMSRSPGHASAPKRTRSRVIAHRAAGLDAPENTLAAVKRAHANGADGVEIDVLLTKDKKAVLMHDEFVDRTTDGQGLVKSYSYKEISQLNAAHHFQTWEERENVPLIDEIASYAVEHGIFLYFDVKDTEYAALDELLRLYENHPKLYELSLVCCFDYTFLYRIRKRDPKILVGPLYGDFWCTQEVLEDLISRYPSISTYTTVKKRVSLLATPIVHACVWLMFYHVNRYCLKFPAVLVQHDLIDESYKKWWDRNDTEVIAWTVNDKARKEVLESIHVSFITDKLTKA